MKKFLIALQFLTILPLTIRGKIEEKDLGGSLIYFPIIGLLLGLFLAGIAYVLAFLPSTVMSALILVMWVAMTGGIHLDGLADTCDGFYGNYSREETLKIMRDSRIGTMGATGITLVLILKLAMLASIHPESLWRILIMAPVFARWSQVLACSTSKYARDEGKAKYFVEYAKRKDMFMGALFTLILFWLLMDIKGIALFAFSFATMFLFIQYVKRRIGGVTGDTIGATSEIAEALALFFGLILSRIFIT